MYYTIYKTTNLINGKFYVGKHQTKDLDDGYLGSGNLLKQAIQKYGIENFKKEILEVFDTEAKMNLAEKILVVIDPEVSYNLCPGGKGGWGYLNKAELAKEVRIKRAHKIYASKKQNGTEKIGIIKMHNKIQSDPNVREKRRQSIFRKYGTYGVKSFSGKNHSEETKLRIGKAAKENQKGNKNSQYGSFWITNGLENKKHRSEIIPDGWYRGRTCK